MKQITETNNTKSNHIADDEDYHFAMQVLASIKRLENKRKALAKLHIHHVEYGFDSNYGPVANQYPPMANCYSSPPMALHMDVTNLTEDNRTHNIPYLP